MVTLRRPPGASGQSAAAARGHPGCPARKLVPPGEVSGPSVERILDRAGERWVVRSFEVARQVLRDSDSVRQAGFGAERVARAGAKMRPPILYLEGHPHRRQRKAAARFFAPKVTEDYRAMMETLSEQLVGSLRTDRPTDLSELSLKMAVQVAAQVIGLTNSPLRAMTRRLDAFFDGDSGSGPLERRVGMAGLRASVAGLNPTALRRSVNHRTALLRFFFLDVKPAIRARRQQRADDVISQLLDQGFGDVDILTECVTYGAAGMATTREFITVAAWHLLDDPDLLAQWRKARTAERLQILEETLRLEPVVGHLYRRSTAPLTLTTPRGEEELAPNSLVDLDIRAINADATVVGAEPLNLCPARTLPSSVPATMMSFGDGNHRCPGGPLALMESEIFLTRLFERDIVADGPPTVQWNAITQGYDLDSMLIRLRALNRPALARTTTL